MKISTILKNKDIAAVFVVTAIILLIPLIAMQFTSKVDWKLLDFISMGTLLIGTGLLIVLAIRKIKNIKHRMTIIIGILIALMLIWGELAVGIFGTPFSGS